MRNEYPLSTAKLVRLFWRFSVVYDAIECIIRCSCGVNVVVVSVEYLLFVCAWLWNVGGVGGVIISCVVSSMHH